jgi:hypothetical protein
VSGYSPKTLVDKLGYIPRENIRLINAPAWFQDYLDSLAITPAVKGVADWGHVFCENQSDLVAFLAENDLESVTKGWWFSWPKKASGVATDLTEQSFRDTILPLANESWVDIKVAAIDDTWSGLKFLRRKS